MIGQYLEGKKVRIINTDDEVFEGIVSNYIFPEDNEPEGVAAIDIDECPQRAGRSVSFYEYRIKTIEILD